jgi:hypothetical protein
MIVDDDGFSSVTVPVYVVVFSVIVSALTDAAPTRPANASAETRTEQERFMVLSSSRIRAGDAAALESYVERGSCQAGHDG